MEIKLLLLIFCIAFYLYIGFCTYVFTLKLNMGDNDSSMRVIIQLHKLITWPVYMVVKFFKTCWNNLNYGAIYFYI